MEARTPYQGQDSASRVRQQKMETARLEFILKFQLGMKNPILQHLCHFFVYGTESSAKLGSWSAPRKLGGLSNSQHNARRKFSGLCPLFFWNYTEKGRDPKCCMKRTESSAFFPSREPLSPEFQSHEKGHIFLLPPHPAVKLCHRIERNRGEKLEISRHTRMGRTVTGDNEQNSHFFTLTSLWAGEPDSHSSAYTPSSWLALER